jgi:hypothetical protein
MCPQDWQTIQPVLKPVSCDLLRLRKLKANPELHLYHTSFLDVTLDSEKMRVCGQDDSPMVWENVSDTASSIGR